MSFRSLTGADARAFLQAAGKRSTAPHTLNKRILHWPYCGRCGLVALKNEVTRLALKQPCVIEED